MNVKKLHSVARLSKRVNALRDEGFLGIMSWGVQVNREAMVFIMTVAEVAVEETSSRGRWRATAIIDGVRFFTVGDESEFIDLGIFEAAGRGGA